METTSKTYAWQYGYCALLVGLLIVGFLVQGVRLNYRTPYPVEVRWNLIYLTVNDLSNGSVRELAKIPIWEVYRGVDVTRKIDNIIFKDRIAPRSPGNAPYAPVSSNGHSQSGV